MNPLTSHSCNKAAHIYQAASRLNRPPGHVLSARRAPVPNFGQKDVLSIQQLVWLKPKGDVMQDDDQDASARSRIEAELSYEVCLLLNAIRDADYVSPPIQKQARNVRECLVRNALCKESDLDA